MKSIYPTITISLFIAALGAFALGRAVELRTDPPPRHEQPDQGEATHATTAADIHALSCLEIKHEALPLTVCPLPQERESHAPCVVQSIPTVVMEVPTQRRFGEKARYWRNCGWEYGWQRFGT